MPRRLSSKHSKIGFAIISLVFIIGGIFLIWSDRITKLGQAQVLGESVEVRAIVLPNPNANLNIGGTTIYYSNLPVVTVNDITIDGQVTNFPVTCSFTFQNPSGQSVTVVTVEPDVNACTYDTNQSPEQQNAKVTEGNADDINSTPGNGQVKVSASLAGKIITTNQIPYKINLQDSNLGPNLNVQNFESSPELCYSDAPIDLISKLNWYSRFFLAAILGLIGFILFYFNYSRIPKYQDFIGDFSMEIQPNPIILGDPICFMSKVVDLNGEPMDNLPCILTVTTPAGRQILVSVVTNLAGICGAYLTAKGLLDNELALKKENLNPAQILSGDFDGFSATPGSGTAFTKSQINSQQYRSSQLEWQVKGIK